MEPKVIYEASLKIDTFLWMLPVALAICTFLLVFFMKTLRSKKELSGTVKLSYFFGCVVCLVTIATVIFASVELIRLYRGTVGAYRRGEYETVEGSVENFRYDNGEESFTVDGAGFSYDITKINFGYHNAGGAENLITGDGQRLRVGYVEYPSLGSVIVYIEELPEGGN